MRITNGQSDRRIEGGFTLFELVVALAIGGMVITSIFKIADGAVQSTTQMMEFQDDDITRDAFFSFLRDHFDSLPGNAEFNLIDTSNSPPYESEMTFQNTPVSFNWGGVPISAQAIRIVTVPTVTNGLDIVLEYYDEKILDSDEGDAEEQAEPIASVTLLYDVRLFEWNVLDIRNYENTERDDWPTYWEQPRRRPGFVELKVVFQNDEAPVRRLFWIPTKQDPATTMSQLQSAARGARQNAGGGVDPTLPGRGGAGRPPGGGNRPGGGRPPGGGTTQPRGGTTNR